MACFSVGCEGPEPDVSPDAPAAIEASAVGEYHGYVAEPGSFTLAQLDVLGLFCVDVKQEGARLTLLHPDDIPDSHFHTVDLLAPPESPANSPQSPSESPNAPISKNPLTASKRALQLLVRQMDQNFSYEDGEKSIRFKTPAQQDETAPVFKIHAPLPWEKRTVPHIKDWELAPATCFRTPPLPKGRHFLNILLHLPAKNMTSWVDVSETKLWIKSPPEYVNCMERFCAYEEDAAKHCRNFLLAWKKQVIEPKTYFVVLLPVSANGKAILPHYEIVGGGAISCYNPNGRSDVQVIMSYGPCSAFNILVEPGIMLSDRKPYRTAVIA